MPVEWSGQDDAREDPLTMLGSVPEPRPGALDAARERLWSLVAAEMLAFERDQMLHVQADQTLRGQADQTLQTLHVQADQTLRVQADQTLRVQTDQTLRAQVERSPQFRRRTNGDSQ
jgi:hypothetical protein